MQNKNHNQILKKGKIYFYFFFRNSVRTLRTILITFPENSDKTVFFSKCTDKQTICSVLYTTNNSWFIFLKLHNFFFWLCIITWL